MSDYLPEGFDGQSANDDGYLKKPISSAGKLTAEERAQWIRYNASVNELSPEFKAWLTNFILVEVAGQLPLSLRGFVTGAQVNEIAAQESTSSTTPVDLTTPGPTLIDLTPGAYLVMWSANIRNTTAASNAAMSMQLNGSSIGAIRAGGSSEFVTCSGFATVSMTANTNILLAKYNSGSATSAEFYDRHLAILRYANA